MAESSIIDLLSKAESSETIALFEEILKFVKEIKPVLDKINSSIEENVKKMPTAAKKISKVTEATELATTEILDIVDRVFPKIDSIIDKIKEVHLDKLDIQKKILGFLQSIEKGISGEIDLSSLLPEIQTAIVKQKEIIDNFNDDDIRQALEDLQSLSSDASSIMIALQVQDITSQQLAAVKHLLDTIQNRLSDILKKFNNSDIQQFLNSSSQEEETENITTLHKEIAFDPHAVDAYDIDANRQEMVDEMFKQHENGKLETDKTNGEIKIDNVSKDEKTTNELESKNIETNNELEPENIETNIDTNDDVSSVNNEEQSTNNEESEKIDAEDIDALFSNTDLGEDEEISQDDIDKLFAGG